MRAVIIQPYERKGNLKCAHCKYIEYSQEHYKVLKDIGKLVYFRFEKSEGNVEDPLCHLCLGKRVMQSVHHETKEQEIDIVDGKKTTKQKFYDNDRIRD